MNIHKVEGDKMEDDYVRESFRRLNEKKRVSSSVLLLNRTLATELAGDSARDNDDEILDPTKQTSSLLSLQSSNNTLAYKSKKFGSDPGDSTTFLGSTDHSATLSPLGDDDDDDDELAESVRTSLWNKKNVSKRIQGFNATSNRAMPTSTASTSALGGANTLSKNNLSNNKKNAASQLYGFSRQEPALDTSENSNDDDELEISLRTRLWDQKLVSSRISGFKQASQETQTEANTKQSQHGDKNIQKGDELDQDDSADLQGSFNSLSNSVQNMILNEEDEEEDDDDFDATNYEAYDQEDLTESSGIRSTMMQQKRVSNAVKNWSGPLNVSHTSNRTSSAQQLYFGNDDSDSEEDDLLFDTTSKSKHGSYQPDSSNNSNSSSGAGAAFRSIDHSITTLEEESCHSQLSQSNDHAESTALKRSMLGREVTSVRMSLMDKRTVTNTIKDFTHTQQQQQQPKQQQQQTQRKYQQKHGNDDNLLDDEEMLHLEEACTRANFNRADMMLRSLEIQEDVSPAVKEIARSIRDLNRADARLQSKQKLLMDSDHGSDTSSEDHFLVAAPTDDEEADSAVALKRSQVGRQVSSIRTNLKEQKTVSNRLNDLRARNDDEDDGNNEVVTKYITFKKGKEYSNGTTKSSGKSKLIPNKLYHVEEASDKTEASGDRTEVSEITETTESTAWTENIHGKVSNAMGDIGRSMLNNSSASKSVDDNSLFGAVDDSILQKYNNSKDEDDQQLLCPKSRKVKNQNLDDDDDDDDLFAKRSYLNSGNLPGQKKNVSYAPRKDPVSGTFDTLEEEEDELDISIRENLREQGKVSSTLENLRKSMKVSSMFNHDDDDDDDNDELERNSARQSRNAYGRVSNAMKNLGRSMFSSTKTNSLDGSDHVNRLDKSKIQRYNNKGEEQQPIVGRKPNMGNMKQQDESKERSPSLSSTSSTSSFSSSSSESSPADMTTNESVADITTIVPQPGESLNVDPLGSFKIPFGQAYRLGEQINKGGFGVVHRAHHVLTDPSAQVAVKIINRGSEAIDEEALNEASILRDIRDVPNVTKLFDYFVDDDKIYVVQELAAGGDVLDRLLQRTTYTENDARELSKLLLEAIVLLHDRRLVHRDLKPENLLLKTTKSDSEILVCDYGHAKYLPDDGKSGLWSMAGTPAYTAPEIVNGVEYWTEVDMWSVGCIIFTLLSGFQPFRAKDKVELNKLISAANYSFDHDRHVWDKISNEAKSLISNLLILDGKNKRLTAKAALQCDWFSTSTDYKTKLESTDLTEPVHKNVKEYCETTRPENENANRCIDSNFNGENDAQYTKLPIKPQKAPEPGESLAVDPLGSLKFPFYQMYVLGDKISEGGFGVVYKAHHVTMEPSAQVAVKVVNRSEANDEEAMHEATILRSIRDAPNITKIFDFYMDNEHIYVVQELAAGGDVLDRLLQRKTYTECDARELSKLLLETISLLHNRRLVHRDLKPENLLLKTTKSDSEILLCDYGYARYLPDDGVSGLWTLCGTPAYTAPEIVNGVEYWAEVDMWSIGCIIYMLLSGVKPFIGDNDAEVFECIAAADYSFDDDPEVWEKISKEAKQLISNLLVLEGRFTVKQALESSWFSTSADYEDQLESTDLKEVMMDNIQEYCNENRPTNDNTNRCIDENFDGKKDMEYEKHAPPIPDVAAEGVDKDEFDDAERMKRDKLRRLEELKKKKAQLEREKQQNRKEEEKPEQTVEKKIDVKKKGNGWGALKNIVIGSKLQYDGPKPKKKEVDDSAIKERIRIKRELYKKLKQQQGTESTSVNLNQEEKHALMEAENALVKELNRDAKMMQLKEERASVKEQLKEKLELLEATLDGAAEDPKVVDKPKEVVLDGGAEDPKVVDKPKEVVLDGGTEDPKVVDKPKEVAEKKKKKKEEDNNNIMTKRLKEYKSKKNNIVKKDTAGKSPKAKSKSKKSASNSDGCPKTPVTEKTAKASKAQKTPKTPKSKKSTKSEKPEKPSTKSKKKSKVAASA